MTAPFGRRGTGKDDSTLLRDGHAASMGEFYGPDGAEEHDDYDGHGGGTRRGKYTGKGS